MEVQAHLKSQNTIRDVSTKIPHGQFTITSECTFNGLSEHEVYGTVDLDLFDYSTGALNFHDILDHANEEIVQYTRDLLIIDCISY
jgi:hypothetical protein